MNANNAAATSGLRRNSPPGKRSAGTRAKTSKRSGSPEAASARSLPPRHGQRHALAGIAMREEHAFAEPAEMRHARARDPDRSAPGIFRRHVCERRIDVQHARADEGGDVLRRSEIAFAAGEQQPVVGALAVIIEDVARIGDRGIRWKHLRAPVRAAAAQSP